MGTTTTEPATVPQDPVWPLDGGNGLPAVEAVGFKAFNLMRMARAGLPVPSGLVLGVSLGRRLAAGEDLPLLLRRHLPALESATGLAFGGVRRPLLLSVRSGAAVSMPGMLESVLNVGLTDQTLRGLLRLTGNPRLAWDCYRRLVESFAVIVHGCPRDPFDAALRRRLAAEDAAGAAELDCAALAELAAEFQTLHASLAGRPFPQDPWQQLEQAVRAVYRSWQAPKAVAYRRLNGIGDEGGTAVTLQQMVYGNSGGLSGAGVGFTRDPATGDDRLYLDFLFNAQGEDVVSGRSAVEGPGALARLLPQAGREIERLRSLLEAEFRDMQEFEFTVQDGRLFLLQARTGKRTPWAALRLAVAMVEEGLIAPAEALGRIAAVDLPGLARRRLAVPPGAVPLARAVPASIGVAVGPAAFTAEQASDLAAAGRPAILLRRDLATEDVLGIQAAAGLVTAQGGRTSHAAVVARQLDKVCLVSCAGLVIDADEGGATLGNCRLAEGDMLSLDGESGAVYAGALAVESERPKAELAAVAGWQAAAGEPAGAR